MNAVQEALRKRELQTRSRQGHKPGTKHTLPDGVEYLVTDTGAWKRITPYLKNALEHNNGKRRRIAAGKS